jgi:hypothetical protein
LKGHGFSRAAKDRKMSAASAAEGCLSSPFGLYQQSEAQSKDPRLFLALPKKARPAALKMTEAFWCYPLSVRSIQSPCGGCHE